MRPVHLHLADFGSFRSPASIDFHDVDYFVLVGPTGAGKSTVIDAICFALYGTVPRWGKENVVSLALAPSAGSGKVALVFETAGRRYGVVRVLARNARGTVATKEARLDELDPSVDPAAGLEELLAAVVRPVAEGEGVTAETQRLTGLDYRFFTQCVILPQGRFAEFLHSQPRDRQNLLVQLLDAEVYEKIKQRAGLEEGRADAAAGGVRNLLDTLTGADEEAEVTAAQRLEEVRTLTARVRTGLDEFRVRDDEVERLALERTNARARLATLDALTMPADVPSLAGDLRTADEAAAKLGAAKDRLETTLTDAVDELAALGDKAALRRSHDAHRDHRKLTGDLAGAEAELADAREAAAAADDEAELARTRLADAEDHHRHARDQHAAAALAQRLTLGAPCPVCLRTLTEQPEHAAPADLEAADHDVAERRRELADRVAGQRAADLMVNGLEQRCSGLRDRLDDLSEAVQAHPDPDELSRRLEEIESTEHRVTTARRDLGTARAEHEKAVRAAMDLRQAAGQALSELDRARDSVVPLGAPQVDRADLHLAWSALLTWRDQEDHKQRAVDETLGAQLAEAQHERDDEWVALRDLLADHRIPVRDLKGPDAVMAALTTASTNAANALERVRENRLRTAELNEQLQIHEQEARVAHELAQRLRANNFQRWLCTEALELLVGVASDTLRALSDGQFELMLGDRSDIQVVDYAEAGMRRSVRTLSGGETFQAALALALALSDQVAGLAASASRSLDSIFLDEGFGTLDPATLDTVATTLERLAVDGERMVGIVTHVPALAERVPVRFEVWRDAAGSHLRKITT